MTFVFQDSVDMPIQRNFVYDLRIFLDLIEKILPLEDKIIELNNLIKSEEDRNKKDISILENYHNEFDKVLNEISSQYTIYPVEECKNTIKESGIHCIEKQKDQLNSDLDHLIHRSNNEIAKMGEQIRCELEPFMWNSIYYSNKTYLITGSTEKVTGSNKINLNGLSYEYETVYSDATLKVKRFIDECTIPVWSKAGLIHKEERIKQLEISEFIITRIFSGEDFQLDLMNKKGTIKIYIKVAEEIKDADIVYITDEACTVTGDEHLSSMIDFITLEKLIEEINKYIENHANILSRKLVTVEIDEKNAIENNEIFDCIKIIASQYGEIINKIFEHGFSRQEIVIKEIVKDGTRNELFISVNEISNRLSALGGEGLEIKDLLNL
jgi:hypothetical protein